MEEFGDATTQSMFIYAQTDKIVSSVIESKYLSYVDRQEDIARLLGFFKARFNQLDTLQREKYSEDGYFVVPLHRFFTFMLARILMRNHTQKQVNSTEEVKDGETVAHPTATNFHNYLIEEGLVTSSEELQSLLELALVSGAK